MQAMFDLYESLNSEIPSEEGDKHQDSSLALVKSIAFGNNALHVLNWLIVVQNCITHATTYLYFSLWHFFLFFSNPSPFFFFFLFLVVDFCHDCV